MKLMENRHKPVYKFFTLSVQLSKGLKLICWKVCSVVFERINAELNLIEWIIQVV